jgi:hypothetical protein
MSFQYIDKFFIYIYIYAVVMSVLFRYQVFACGQKQFRHTFNDKKISLSYINSYMYK